MGVEIFHNKDNNDDTNITPRDHPQLTGSRCLTRETLCISLDNRERAIPQAFLAERGRITVVIRHRCLGANTRPHLRTALPPRTPLTLSLRCFVRGTSCTTQYKRRSLDGDKRPCFFVISFCQDYKSIFAGTKTKYKWVRQI